MAEASSSICCLARFFVGAFSEVEAALSLLDFDLGAPVATAEILIAMGRTGGEPY